MARRRGSDGERFVAALCREIEGCCSGDSDSSCSSDNSSGALPGTDAASGRFDTVYFGGGTPSALGVEQLAAICDRIRGVFTIEADAEWTIEVNPEDASPESLREWRDLGFDRISLGVQALDDSALRFLGRRHDGRQALASVELARETGFRSVSVDLIYSLPGFGAERWLRTLGDAAALGPDHLSCYELTIHDGTPFGRRRDTGRLRAIGEDERAANFIATHRRLGDLGYEGYEVSNFARSRADRSRHNRKYWRHVPCLGLGPSAHSFDGRQRWWNAARWQRWCEAIEGGASPVAGVERLTDRELLLEAVMMGLRQRSGIDCAALERRFGFDCGSWNARQIETWERAGWLRISGRRLEPTLEGMARADRLAAEWTLDADTWQQLGAEVGLHSVRAHDDSPPD